MSQIVYSNALYPGFLTSSVHFSMEITFGNWEYATVRFSSIELPQIILNFIAQELRHLNDTVALFCLGCGNDILLISKRKKAPTWPSGWGLCYAC